MVDAQRESYGDQRENQLMRITSNVSDILRRVAKDLVKKKGLTPQEASERTGVPVADILREYEEPSPSFTVTKPDGTKKEHGRE